MNSWFLVSALVFATALAGCVSNDDSGSPTMGAPTTTEPGPGTTEPAPTTIDETSFAVAVTNFPTTVTAGEAFNFTVDVTGDATATSDHIGAHFGGNSSTAPSTTVYGSACAHSTGAVPGSFAVTCVLPDAGTAYLRGHMRYTPETGSPINYWGDEITVTVAEPSTPAPALNASAFMVVVENFPVQVVGNVPFSFKVNVTGNTSAASDHIGAHFGRNTTTTPSTMVYDNTCEHTAGTAPGVFDVTCTVTGEGEWFLRGHMRITPEAGDAVNFWGDEIPFTVLLVTD